MAVIYKATNKINGRAYIGFDSNWPNRKKDHIKLAKSGNGYYFDRAIAKYGPENFEWEILLNNATLEDEIRLIEEHDTFCRNNGYNLTKGGDGSLGYIATKEARRKISVANKNNKAFLGRKHTTVSKQKMSNALKGRSFSDDHKRKIGEAHKGNSYWLGKKHTEETKKKLSESKKGNQYCRGKPKSEDTKRKMSESYHRRKNASMDTHVQPPPCAH